MVRTLVGFFVLTGCIADSDSDGFPDLDDCQDEDASINPGAAEICDGIDNDCNGAVDDGVTSTFYTDADGDGYGNVGYPAEACAASDGYVSDGTDCDDTDSAIHPGAEEVCDGIDNDCDGASDDEDDGLSGGASYYADSDGDGYGDSSTEVRACAAPGGHTTDSADCDDTNAAVRPGAREDCDGIDNDCDSQTNDLCALSGSYHLADIADFGVRISDQSGSGVYELIGWAVDSAGDVDGDGITDLLIGDSQHSAGGSGGAYIVHGPVTAEVDLPADATPVLTATTETESAAYSVLGNHDLDEDGYDDIMLGSIWDSQGGNLAGAVYLLYGPVTPGSSISAAGADLVIEGLSSNGMVSPLQVGSGMDWGAHGGGGVVMLGANLSFDGTDHVGAVYFFDAATLSTYVGDIGVDTTADVVWGTVGYEGIGGHPTVGGDFNGDGTSDLLIDWAGYDIDPASDTDEGAVALYFSTPKGSTIINSGFDLLLTGDAPGDMLFQSSMSSDFNNDGYDDLVLGAPSDGSVGTGKAYIIHGQSLSTTGISSSVALADTTLIGDQAGEQAGIELSSDGDADADGAPDLLIGARTYGDSVGRAYLLHSPIPAGTLSLLSDADAIFEGEQPNMYTGRSLTFVDDINGDGSSELLLGAYGPGESASVDSAAYLIFGAGY